MRPSPVRLVAVVLLLGACAAQTKPVTPVPVTRPTAGSPLLAHIPAGADVVAELDLARLRANPIVGPPLPATWSRSSRR